MSQFSCSSFIKSIFQIAYVLDISCLSIMFSEDLGRSCPFFQAFSEFLLLIFSVTQLSCSELLFISWGWFSLLFLHFARILIGRKVHELTTKKNMNLRIIHILSPFIFIYRHLICFLDWFGVYSCIISWAVYSIGKFFFLSNTTTKPYLTRWSRLNGSYDTIVIYQ